ncbi:hypothetical protein ACLI08_11355 [Flavobacterium sp. RNTU_13]|uniref:hypothetical protein n=1 Tax=Flavobacterium sp. RNTU_13 TaxID=3375145 RepID=UPI0039864E82
MKKFVLLFALVASLSTTLVSCSADDSDIQSTNNAQGENLTIGILPPPRANG